MNINEDKGKAVLDWLRACPYIKDLYYIFSQMGGGDTTIIPDTAYSDEWAEDMPFIDGTGDKIYTFAIVHSVEYSSEPNSNENVDASIAIQKIADWVTVQSEQENYPAFPENCTINEIEVLPFENGGFVSADEKTAQYQFQVQIKYYYEGE